MLSPNASDPNYLSEYSSKNIHIQQLSPNSGAGLYKKSRRYRFFSKVRQFTLITSDKKPTLSAHISSELQRPTNTLKIKLFLRSQAAIAKVISNSRVVRNLFFGLENRLFSSNHHSKLFDKFQPDLVATTDVGTTNVGNMLLREAHSHKVKTTAVILSWDNLTSKGVGSTRPDSAIAWNSVMKDELTKYHGIKPENVTVGGIAHYDGYFNNVEIPSKSEWLEEHGLDPTRKTLFFGTATATTFMFNARLLRLLLDGINDDKFSEPCQILVRLHPVFLAKPENNPALDELEKIARNSNGLVVINRPQMIDMPIGFNYDIQDQRTIAGIMQHSDVMVNLFSTLMLEACIFDLPVVNSALYTYRKTNISNKILTTFGHINPLLKMDAMHVAETENQMFDHINSYLQNRALHQPGRARIRSVYGGPNKGNAVQSIANKLIATANSDNI